MAYRASFAQEVMLTSLNEYFADSGLTYVKIESRLGWYNGKAGKILQGKVSVSLADLNKLMELLDVPASECKKLRTLRTQTAAKRPWWDDHEWISPAFAKFLTIEDQANDIRHVGAMFIPGLLQTEQYMERLFSETPQERGWGPSEAVELRLRRQRILKRTAFTAFIAEAALHGGPDDVMRGQLDHLIAAAKMPKVNIRIISRRHLMTYHVLDVMTVPYGKTLVATEVPLSGSIIYDDASHVRRALEIVQSLEAHTLSCYDSLEILTKVRGEMG